MKRILSGIFAALLILCALPVAAFAEQQPSDIDPITVQPISASGGEIVRPTWLAYGPITQYPAEGGTWEYGFWDAKVRSYYTVDRCHGSTVVLNGNTVRSVLEIVGLQGREKDKALVLSGGEKQRLGIARAILKNASVIFADEPTASLDNSNRQLVVSLLKDCANRGAAIILATHDERLVAECDTVVRLGT